MVLSEGLAPSDFSVKTYAGAGWGNGWWVSGGSECRTALIRSPGEGPGALIWLGGEVEERVRFGWVLEVESTSLALDRCGGGGKN